MRRCPLQIRFFTLFALYSSVIGGITGTITGHVNNGLTGESLPGVQVIIDGSNRGAVCDVSGVFYIVNIPPGKYDLRFEMIGYSKKVVTGVQVVIDLQTQVNVKLSPSSLEGETVIVESKTMDLTAQITSTTRFISPNLLDKLPILNYQELVESLPGVTAGHVRGGRKSELIYLVDGMPIQNTIDGKAGTDLPNTSIVDISVQTGGFTAEYGNAMSGVVNILTKEGTGDFFLKTQSHVLNYSNNPQPFTGEKVPEYMIDLAVGGPIFSSNTSYFFSGDISFPSTRTLQEQFGVRKMIIYDPDSSMNINLTGKLSASFLNHSLRLTLQDLYSNWQWREYDHVWKYNLGALPGLSKKSNRIAGTVSHTLTAQTFYELNLSFYSFIKSVYGQKDALERIPVVSDSGYVLEGAYPWWMDHIENQLYSKFVATTQLSEKLQFKGGGSFTQYYLYRKNVHRKDIKNWSDGFPVYIMYDSEYEYEPRRGSLFLQGKYVSGTLVINSGVRYDFFDPRAARPQIEVDLTELDHDWVIDTVSTVPASVKISFSPRVGMAWVINEDSKFHFNYGYFFQMPSFDYLYTNPNLNIANGFSTIGDSDLKPAQTRAIEFGMMQSLGDWGIIDFVIFSKDVVNLIDSNTLLVYGNNYQKEGFTRFINVGQSDIQGLEVYFDVSFSNKFSGDIAYTMMTARGSSSYSLEGLWKNYEVTTRGTELYPLSWDQRHTLDTNLEFSFNTWLASVVSLHYNSGLPYTLDKGEYTTPNGERMKATHDIDLRINGLWEINNHTRLNAFFEVTNILDQQNVLWVDSNGIAGGILSDPGAYDLSRRFRVGVGFEF